MPTTPTGEGASGAAEVRVLSVRQTLKIEPFKIQRTISKLGEHGKSALMKEKLVVLKSPR